MSCEITIDDLVQAMEGCQVKNDPGKSAEELSWSTGYSIRTIQVRLNRMVHEGTVKVGRRREVTHIGRVKWVPVYAAVKKGR